MSLCTGIYNRECEEMKNGANEINRETLHIGKKDKKKGLYENRYQYDNESLVQYRMSLKIKAFPI